MSIILIRTVIIYVVLVGAMRLMGKRQLGQLEVSDLVSTLLLSEIAALPIENHSIPLVYAIIPIILVLAAEVFSAALLSRFPGLKNILSTRPTVLVKMGKPREDELKRARISADELMVALRRAGSTDIGGRLCDTRAGRQHIGHPHSARTPRDGKRRRQIPRRNWDISYPRRKREAEPTRA